MLGATHMLFSAAVYKKAPNLFGGFVLAFLSHFLLDTIPHFELRSGLNYGLAVLAGLLLCASAWPRKDFSLLVAAFLGALVDLNWIFNLSSFLINANDFFHQLLPQISFFFLLEPLVILISLAQIFKESPLPIPDTVKSLFLPQNTKP